MPPKQQNSGSEEQKPLAEEKQVAAKKEEKVEISLQYGQAIIHPIDNPENEILTTIDDWNSLYNAGANQGKFVLKAEKKS